MLPSNSGGLRRLLPKRGRIRRSCAAFSCWVRYIATAPLQHSYGHTAIIDRQFWFHVRRSSSRRDRATQAHTYLACVRIYVTGKRGSLYVLRAQISITQDQRNTQLELIYARETKTCLLFRECMQRVTHAEPSRLRAKLLGTLN